MALLFDKPGPENTTKALELAFKTADQRQLEHILVASTTGETAAQALPYFESSSATMVVITHNTGFNHPGEQQFSAEIKKKVQDAGALVYTGSLVLRGAGAAVRKAFGGSQEELINMTLRMICQGAKVGVEIAAMACDAGLAPPGPVVTVSGTGRGADTVMIVEANSSNHFFDIHIQDIIAKPK